MSNKAKAISAILERGKGEREIFAYLKKNKDILISAFCTSWNYKTCVPEFCFGNDFKSDFLILCANSGFWTAIFIELESPNGAIYLRNGTSSKVLRVAQRQVSDWKNWIRVNESYLRQRFGSCFKDSKVSAQCSKVDDHNLAETEITDSHTVIHYDYKIIIGRRSSLSKINQERRSNENNEIITFDRLIEVAKRLDEFKNEE